MASPAHLRTGARSLGQAPPLRAVAAIVDATRAAARRAVDGLLVEERRRWRSQAVSHGIRGFVVLAARACASAMVGRPRARGQRLAAVLVELEASRSRSVVVDRRDS